MDIFVWMKLFVQRVSLQFWHSLFDYSSGTLITFSTTLRTLKYQISYLRHACTAGR